MVSENCGSVLISVVQLSLAFSIFRSQTAGKSSCQQVKLWIISYS